MNRTFARTISLLRREKGVSQKEAAAALGVSQALLSHYEKGIRECSLEFVVRLADYYRVSTDYLLGRSPLRTAEETPPLPPAEEPPAVLFREEERVHGSVTVLFSVLRRIRDRQLASMTADALEIALYRFLRALYTLNGRGGPRVFRISDSICDSTADAAETLLLQRFRRQTSNAGTRGESLFEDKSYVLSPERIAEEFPQMADAVFDLAENAENQLMEWLRIE